MRDITKQTRSKLYAWAVSSQDAQSILSLDGSNPIPKRRRLSMPCVPLGNLDMAGSGIQHTAMVRPRLSGILARALLGTVAALSTGAATGGLLELVGKREDLTPWRDMPAATVDAWLRKGIRFDSDDEALVSKFYYAKLVYLANLLKDGTYRRPFLIERGVYRGMWFESVPVTMQVFARIDLPAAKIQLREFVRLQMPDGYIPYKIIPSGPGERSIGFGWIAFAVWHLHLLDG